MDLSGISLPFDISGMMSVGWGFVGIYKEYIILVLGALFIYCISGPILNLISYVSNKYAADREWKSFAKEERQRTYDYLTEKGRISERDEWVKKTGNPYS